MINDLIGLRYKSGAQYFKGCQEIDCFFLFAEVRHRLGLHEYCQESAIIYDEMLRGTIPAKKALSLISQFGEKTKEPRDGDMAILSASFSSISIGTVINGGILAIAHDRQSFWTPSYRNARIWTPKKDCKL